MCTAKDDLRDPDLLQKFVEAYAKSVCKEEGWADANMPRFKQAAIHTVSELKAAASNPGIFSQLMVASGIDEREIPDSETVASLARFLPGTVGGACLRLAREVVAKLKVHEDAATITSYEHRPRKFITGRRKEHRGKEVFTVPGALTGAVDEKTGNVLVSDEPWELRTDCAGLIRNLFESVTHSEVSGSHRSDRPFMRAKDFKAFFRSLEPVVSENFNATRSWLQVTDLEHVVPGDIIAYSVEGRAIGGADFVETKSLAYLVEQVSWVRQTSDCQEEGAHADAERIKWKDTTIGKLKQIGITTVDGLKEVLEAEEVTGEDVVNEKLSGCSLALMNKVNKNLLREACDSKSVNTGHVVLACGFPEFKEKDQNWRLRIIHCTGSTQRDKTKPEDERQGGIEQWYKRFNRNANGCWVTSRGNMPVAIGRLCV